MGEVSTYADHHLRLLGAVSERITVTLDRLGLTLALRRQQELQGELVHQAHHDPLTGLANRRQLEEAITALLRGPGPSSAVGDRAMVLLLLDLNGFKAINDRLGHGAGDEVLRVVADRLRGSIRGSDLVARLGGDEFVVLSRHQLTAAGALDLAARVLAAVSGPATVDGQYIEVMAIVGVAMATADVPDCAELLRRADVAMYEAQRCRDGRPRAYDYGATLAAGSERALVADLGRAIHQGAVRAVFQPVFSLATRQLHSVTSLRAGSSRSLAGPGNCPSSAGTCSARPAASWRCGSGLRHGPAPTSPSTCRPPN
jgi:diguanylate cyclase (GGDEF)-like protein